MTVEVRNLLHPAPGDVVVCQVEEPFTVEGVEAATERLAELFPHNRVLLLPEGWRVGCVDEGVARRLVERAGAELGADVPLTVEGPR